MSNLRLSIFAALAIATASPAVAQKADAPFLKIGDSVTTYGEFKRMYLQNKDAALIPMTEAEYATLFTNYKLKVAEARAMGLDTLRSYKDECKYYIADLQRPYLEDTTVFAKIAARQRARLNEEVKVEHILAAVRANATPADTLAAYQRIVMARQRVLAGEDFGLVAAECSEDPSAKHNRGNLGYFSAFQMVPIFEDVAFNTPVGEYSDIFRTNFGYHFLHVSDRRMAEGQVSVQHIMKIVPSASPELEAGAKSVIDSLYAVMTSDTAMTSEIAFAKMARQYSDDRQSAIQGGMMPWFTRSQILPEFADAAFSLQANGEISKPVRTRAGWHIIRRVDRRTTMPDDDFNRTMRRLRQDRSYYRFEPLFARMGQLAREYDFRWDAAGRDSLVSRSLLARKVEDRKAVLSDNSIVLARVKDRVFTLADVAADIDMWRTDRTTADNLHHIQSTLLKAYEIEHLEAKYPDFAALRREYVEGLLVFDVTQRKVWNVKPDSATVDSLYTANPKRYSKGGTFDGSIYFCSSPKDAAKLKTLLAKGKKDKAAKIAYQVINGPISQGDFYDDFVWPLFPVSEYVVVDGTATDGTVIPLNECRGVVINDYQQITERKFIEALKAKFNPVQLLKLK